jgi:molybdenum cofactor cytidylyltransferase
MGVAAAETLASELDDIIIIVRPEDTLLMNTYQELGLKVIINQQADKGMAASIITGVQASLNSSGWLIALADMPWIKTQTIQILLQELSKGASLVAPFYKGQRGHPVGFSSQWLDQLMQLQGDAGARAILQQHQDELTPLHLNDPGILRDVDYPSDLYSPND